METEPFFQSRVDFGHLSDALDQLRTEVGKIVVGQQEMLELIIAALLSDGHVLLEGVPGIAKTLTAKLVARTLAVDFSRIQFTPDLMPSDIVGTSIFNTKSSEFEFKRGPVFSNVVLIDEINRAPAKTQAALFEVMEERQVTVDGTTYPMTPPFVVLATQNPIDQEGTYRLPEAQLDRFMFKIEVSYPTLDEETRILMQAHARREANDPTMVQPVLSADAVATYRARVRAVHCDDPLLRYIAQIVEATRNNSALYLGASPRASLAIMIGAKAFAAMAGRDFVTPDDIRRVVTPVLQHRILLTPEREMEGVVPKDVIKQIVEKIEVPR
ncbi:MAG TPA: MoxR family ATPase [Candidatus Kapabacteria bacterium]|nr:MoxR family ATPase [Candidatus Kapabacteria bacterium]